MSARDKVLQALSDGSVGAASPLAEVPYVGDYLSARAGRALRVAGPTVGDLWAGTRRRARAVDFVRKIVQNDRANRCVPARASLRSRTYHVGDLNQKGYEAFATLLNHARARVHPNAAYAALPLRPARTRPRRAGA